MKTTIKIARPTDDYSPLWPLYWSQNPHLGRGVGADAAAEGAGAGEGEGEGGGEDLEALRRDAAEAKKLREENELFKKKNQEAEKHRKEQERVARENAEKAARASGDIETLEKSWTEKYTNRETELSTEVGTYRGMVEELTAGATANEICSKIAMEGCSPALMPHVRARLKSEVKDGKPVTRVLDAAGNVSAMTPDDLIKELKAVPYLAPLIIGSRAAGGGPPGGNGGGNNSKQMSRNDWQKLDGGAKAKFFADGGKLID
jgi:hypothetical protein